MRKDMVPRRSCWRDGFGPGETIQRVRPRESFEYLHNPHRGTATFQRFEGDPVEMQNVWDDRHGPLSFVPFHGDPAALRNSHYPRTTVAYCRWIWADLEPEKGHIRWDVLDGALEAARMRGQTLQIRIQPYIRDDLPGWYWAAGAKEDSEAARRGRREPDHNDPLYVQHWGDLIRALGARYDGHPDLESVDIAYGGPCGEMGGNATPETAAELVDVYLTSFRRTQLLSMAGTHGCRYAAGKRGRAIGWRGDCFGDVRADGKGVVPDHLCWNHMYDEYPRVVVQDGIVDAWMRAPVTLETCWTVGHWYEKGWDIDWILDQCLKYHPAIFMPKSAYLPEPWQEKIDAFDRRLGYRLVLRQMVLPLEARPGSDIRVSVWMDNVGVAPLYRPYHLALRLRQGERSAIVCFRSDPRTWLPGHAWFEETLRFPEGFEPGEVKVDVGLIDAVHHQPRVRLAIEGPVCDGWHLLTSIDAAA